MTFYIGQRHFTYANLRVEPGMVFPKLAVRNNHLLEKQGQVEIYLGKEDNLIPCPECPAKFADTTTRDRHVERNLHAGGRVIMSEEGIRTIEQESELDALQASLPRERPGRVLASPDRTMKSAPKAGRR